MHNVIVIDNGSDTTRAGRDTFSYPKLVFPTIIGKYNMQHSTSYVGENHKAGTKLITKKPVEHGIFHDANDMETIWQHIFKELYADPTIHPILLTEKPHNPSYQRKKSVQILFENFNVPALYLALQPVLSLYSSGRTTGVVLESSEGITHSVPVYEGYAIINNIQRLLFGGKDITYYLDNLITYNRNFVGHQKSYEIARDLKEKFGYVAYNFLEEPINNSVIEHSYVLPDGNTIKIKEECYKCSEPLFDLSILGLQGFGIHEMVHNSVMRCHEDIHGVLYGNIVVSGGNCGFKGVEKRMEKEMKALANSAKVFVPSDKKNSVWLGGAILGSMSTFEHVWISRQDYDEYGPDIVFRKCF